MRYERQRLELGRAQLLCTRIIGQRSDEQIVEHLEEYRTILLTAYERRQKLVDILDIRQAAPPTPKQRRLQGAWNTQHEELMHQTLVGFTFVVSSTVMRGIITAITWIKPLPMPTAVFTDLEDAIRWGFKRLDEEGVVVSRAAHEEARRMFVDQHFAEATARR